MNVIIAREAIEDLVSIGDYIASSNPRRADSFVDELYERCLSLSEAPFAFEKIVHRTDRDIRRRPYGRYLIFYEICPDRIEVIRIAHGARNYMKLLFPGP